MQIGRVAGNLVSTLKHPALRDRKLLVVEPCDLAGKPGGRKTVAVDVVDAGPGDWVLFLDEGSSASQILANPRGPVRTVVVGVVDGVSRSG
jgi:microcompartment protein CcmK/EutM